MPSPWVVTGIFGLVAQLIYLFARGKEAAAFTDKVLAREIKFQLASAFRTKTCQL
jgi:hypothetical protein